MLDAFDLPTLPSYITYARQHIHRKISDKVAEDLIRDVMLKCVGRENFLAVARRLAQYILKFNFCILCLQVTHMKKVIVYLIILLKNASRCREILMLC